MAPGESTGTRSLPGVYVFPGRMAQNGNFYVVTEVGGDGSGGVGMSSRNAAGDYFVTSMQPEPQELPEEEWEDPEAFPPPLLGEQMSTAPATPAKQDVQIVIDGEIARITRTVIERTVKTSDLITELGKLHPISTGLLPKNCIAYLRSKDTDNRDRSVYVVELPAGMTTIKYRNARLASAEELPTEEFKLSWPYTQWLVKFAGTAISSLHLCCTKTSVTSLDDDIFILPMPNSFEGGAGSVCLGNLTVPVAPIHAKSVEGLIHTMLTSLWNADLAPNFSRFDFDGFTGWAARSKDNPEYWKHIDFYPHPSETLARLMQSVLGEEKQ